MTLLSFVDTALTVGVTTTARAPLPSRPVRACTVAEHRLGDIVVLEIVLRECLADLVHDLRALLPVLVVAGAVLAEAAQDRVKDLVDLV